MTRRLLALVAACAVLAGGGAAVAAPAPTATATTVRLAVLIETSSDWTKVLLRPGTLAASRVLRSTPGTRVVSGSLGWEVRPVAGSAVVELDAVFDDAGRAASYALEVQKGAVGATTVRVRNTTGTPYTALTTTNARSTTEVTNSQTATVAGDRLRGTRQLALPRADDRRLVLAFAYPWFSGGYGDPQLTERPRQPRSTATAAGVASMTSQARAAGVDGFVLSWSGAARDGAEADLFLAAAARTGGVVAPYLETTEAAREAARTGRTTYAVVQSWLGEWLRRSTGPASLRAGGEAVVFVWDARQLTPDEWAALRATARLVGRPVRLVTDAHEPAYDAVSWGRHRYTVNDALPALAASHRHLALRERAPAVLDPGTAPGLYAATVSPGFDDRRLRGGTNPVVPRGANGERYAGSWAAATASRPDWVLVNSWNEWYEGTTVEPGTVSGDLALRQTRERSWAWRAVS